jgi:Transposase DNA-binding
MAEAGNVWLDDELSECRLADERLTKRLRKLLEQMGGAVGSSIPLACQDWANTKAAYRFFSNDRVNEAEILAGHFRATRRRFDASDGPVLVLQDTTEFTYQRNKPALIGITKSVNSGKDKAGRLRKHTVCGLLMHSSLVVTLDGLPLGLAAIKFWTRATFKGTAALKRKINPTRVPIEQKESFRWLENLRQSHSLLADPSRCVHVGDRESDIYELFCVAQDLGTHFLVRTCVDRLAGDGGHTIAAEMNGVEPCGTHAVTVRDGKGRLETAEVELKYHCLRVLPPIGKQKRYRSLTLTVLHARERKEPAGRPRIDWKLITDLPVGSLAEAVEKLRWYALRWKIEVFHKILKSGCRAEDAKLRTAERLTRLISVFCILAWRVFWMTMIHRSRPDAEPGAALTPLEMKILDRLVPNRTVDPPFPATISIYLIKVARLGGYLARNKDPPPGNTVIWRGMSRLADITLGADLTRTGYG